jgi:hypothetical protein
MRCMHWCPNGCGKKVAYNFCMDVTKIFRCQKCNETFSKKQLLDFTGKYKRLEIFI